MYSSGFGSSMKVGLGFTGSWAGFVTHYNKLNGIRTYGPIN